MPFLTHRFKAVSQEKEDVGEAAEFHNINLAGNLFLLGDLLGIIALIQEFDCYDLHVVKDAFVKLQNTRVRHVLRDHTTSGYYVDLTSDGMMSYLCKCSTAKLPVTPISSAAHFHARRGDETIKWHT